MSGGSPALALKEEDVTKLLASSTHLGSTNLDFQMEQYVFKRRADADGGESSGKSKKQGHSEPRRSTAAQFFVEEEKHQSSSSSRNKPEKSKKTSVECRRSTAAQFFVEEETVQQAATAERVVELLNDAVVSKQNTLNNLFQVQELILHKEPQLLDNFLDEVVSFQHDRNAEVRKFVVSFIEQVCKIDHQMLPKVIGNLIIMVTQDVANVQKRVIQATTQLYKIALKWLCSAKSVDEIMEALWASMVELKNKIVALLESENDGVRTQVVRFMETVILAQTYKDEYTVVKEGDISLDDIPMIMKIFRPRRMEEEAKNLFDMLIAFHGASHISNYNLMTCIQTLATISRKRFEFFPKVLQAFESLHANLPPTLGQSQVSSVRKTLKLHLTNIAKHPAAEEFYVQISTLLSDLGATPQQIAKIFPKLDVSRKRPRLEADPTAVKKPKLEDSDFSAQDKEDGAKKAKIAEKIAKAKNTAIDITAEDLYPRLTGVNVSDLVLVSMLSLPEVMPVQFQSSYTPIAAAGTEPQIRHLARLLAAQLTVAGLGKGVEETRAAAAAAAAEGKAEESEEEEDEDSKKIKTVVGGAIEQKKKKAPLVLMPTGSKSTRFPKRLNLLEITKPLSEDQQSSLSRLAFGRILNAEKSAAKRGVSAMRSKILGTLATQLRGTVSQDLRDHILENPRARLDLAFSWMYEEYIAYQGFNSSLHSPLSKYEETVANLLGGFLQNEEQKHHLFNRMIVDAPYVTLSMLIALKAYCVDEDTAKQALQIAKSMTLRKPPKKLDFLGVISELTLHEKLEVRNEAVSCAVELHQVENLKPFIEAFALRSLKFLLQPMPPPEFILTNSQPTKWTEDLTKIALHLYLSLLPMNHHLIHDLGTVYVETTADIKRIILRALEAPVKGMSMRSPELLLFVENCPKGAETLVTRIIHILTDKAPPSAELVSRVRDLYHKRVPDVRFLIPIINGLSKKEVIAALPELIKLNPTVVKEVFNRLLGSNFVSPLSPAELLVALHNIDPAKCNLKTVIKATSLCFEEKNVYTQVVLAVVIQQLMEQNPLPILLMRTVIQSLANYPHLLGFVTNILKRLIEKQVWKQKRIWEGFIKCCQRTKPQSFQVLLQLPAPQLKEVLQSCQDLRNPLCQHVEAFTESQKAHIPHDVMDVISSFNPSLSRETSQEASFDKNEQKSAPTAEDIS